jgi:hypothetical protein
MSREVAASPVRRRRKASETVMTAAERFREEGREQGQKNGREQSQRENLLVLLSRRDRRVPR